VALKMIRGGGQASAEDLARFRTEAEALERRVGLSRAWGKKEQADQWRQKSAAAKVGAGRR
jgi:hypothetical protein